MFKNLFLFLAILLAMLPLFCSFNEAQQMSNIPGCTGISGKDAIVTENGNVHMVYFGDQIGVNTNLMYVRITGENVYSHTVDSGTFYGVDAPNNSFTGYPTLLVEGSIIHVFYCKDANMYTAVSNDNGITFNTQISEPGQDGHPLVRKENGVYTAFNTNSDDYADSTNLIFSNIEQYPSGGSTYYWGPDVLYGPIRSNSDIWIKQLGGGMNSGWPTFYGPVYTSGQIQSYSGTPPYAQIFRGGYFEHVKPLNPDYQSMRIQIEQNGSIVGSPTMDENRITFVTVTGGTYSSWIGQIVQAGFDTLWVYGSYPPATGEPWYANYVPHVDTLWSAGPSDVCFNRSMIVNSQLWIKGRFSGKQTWYSPYDIKLAGDITLGGTSVGESPDGSNGGFLNTTDYVALVSGKQIQVQYGYRDPADSRRLWPNCLDGIYIYASLFAIRPDSGGNAWKDGVFTYEYLKPHSSIPAAMYNDALYDNIDLHRRHYPQTADYPWQPNIDLPYYNPLWPEGNPYMERGTIHLYGSINQQRKGYTHCALSDTEFPNPNGIWDPDQGYFGSIAGNPVTDPILGHTYAGINAPGTTGGGIGYAKDYHFDNRLEFNTFAFNPFGLGLKLKYSVDLTNWNYSFNRSLNEKMLSKSADTNANVKVFQYNNHIICQPTPGSEYAEINLPLGPNDKVQEVQIKQNVYFLSHILTDNPAGQDSVKILLTDATNGNSTVFYNLPVVSNLNTLGRDRYGYELFANLQAEGIIQFHAPFISRFVPIYEWNPQIHALQSLDFDPARSKLIIQAGEDDSLDVYLAIASTTSPAVTLYHARGRLNYVHNEDDTTPQLAVQTSVYPNPFRQEMTLKITTNQKVNLDARIYNLRGQLVKTLIAGEVLAKGSHAITWDGTDTTGKGVGSGFYFIRSNTGNLTRTVKVLRIQ